MATSPLNSMYGFSIGSSENLVIDTSRTFYGSGNGLTGIPPRSLLNGATAVDGTIPFRYSSGESFTWIPYPIKLLKTTTTSIVNNNTLTIDSDFTIALVAGKTYRITGYLIFGSTSATPQFKFGMSYSGSYSVIHSMVEYCGFNTNSWAIAITQSLQSSVSVPSGSAGTAPLKFDIIISATTNGNFNLLWAQNNSNATSTNCYRGSYIEYITC